MQLHVDLLHQFRYVFVHFSERPCTSEIETVYVFVSVYIIFMHVFVFVSENYRIRISKYVKV